MADRASKQFFAWDHAQQVRKVADYLDFLAQQPAAAHFTTSSKASVSFASAITTTTTTASSQGNDLLLSTTLSGVEQSLHAQLLDGRTRSGFGAFGTEPGFLPQKELSLEVAGLIERIGHRYRVETSKKARQAKPPELNSRSFFFYWCHAEKQKLVDIRRKLAGQAADVKRKCWQSLVVHVDRPMCADCIEFATCLAASEAVEITVSDPVHVRRFPAVRDAAIHQSPHAPTQHDTTGCTGS